MGLTTLGIHHVGQLACDAILKRLPRVQKIIYQEPLCNTQDHDQARGNHHDVPKW